MPILGSPLSLALSENTTFPPGWRFPGSLVQVGNCTFGLSDENGTNWHLINLQGWDDTPEVVSQKKQRVSAHGVHLGPQTYGARTLTLDGSIVARTTALRQQALQQLHRSLPVNALSVVRVSDPPERYVQARIDGPLRATRIGTYCWAIQIPMVCADPRKYGFNPDPVEIGLPQYEGGVDLPTSLPVALPVRISGGTGEAVNAGDMDAPWIAHISGPVGTPVIEAVDLGRRMAVNIDLGAGETLTLDSRAKTVVLNGTASRAGLITRGSSWFELPAESTSTIRYSSSTFVPGATPNLLFTPLSAWS